MAGRTADRALKRTFPHSLFAGCRAADRVPRVELCHAGMLEQQVSRRAM